MSISATMRLRNQKITINGKSISVTDTAAFNREIAFLRQKAGALNSAVTGTANTAQYKVETSLRLKSMLAAALAELHMAPEIKGGMLAFTYQGTAVTAAPEADGSYSFTFAGAITGAKVQACVKDIICQYGAVLQQSVYDQITEKAAAANLKLVNETVEKDKTVVLVYEM